MNEAKLDRQSNELRAKEELRQKTGQVSTHYITIKGMVATIQDAAEAGKRVENSNLLNLLEEPLEKLNKLIDIIDPKEYLENLIKQRKYLVSSIDKLDVNLKERFDYIVKLFDSLIDKLSSDTEKKKLQIELLNQIFNSEEKEFDVDYYANKGVDFNELIDCKDIDLPSDSKWITKISIFGACLQNEYDSNLIENLLKRGADANKICIVAVRETDENLNTRNYYPLSSIFDSISQGILNKSRLEILLKNGMKINGICFEEYNNNPKFYDNKTGVLPAFFLNCESVEDKIIEVVNDLRYYGLKLDNTINRNFTYMDGEKITVVNLVFRYFPLYRKLQKLFIGCSYNKESLLEWVLGAYEFNNLSEYLKSKNYLLFLAGNNVNILTDFSYRLQWSNSEDKFIGSILGVLAKNIYRQDRNDALDQIIIDFENLLKALNVSWNYIALKNNGNEYSFNDVRRGNI